MKEIYPGEGHVNVKLPNNQFMFFGGTSRSSEDSWPGASSISILETFVTKDDVCIDNILSPKVVGGHFPPLQDSATVEELNYVYLWVGLNLNSFTYSHELNVLDTTLSSRGGIEVEMCRTPMAFEEAHAW